MSTTDANMTPENEVENYVAKQLENALRGEGGITLHVIDPKSTFKLQESRAQIRKCSDIDAVLLVIHQPVVEHPEFLMFGTLDDAIEASASYGEKALDGIEGQHARWNETVGFESTCHLRQIIEAVTMDVRGTESALITLNATMGAEAPVVIARTPEWSIAIEAVLDNHFPANVFATLDSLRRLLS